jgi:hypothetical protein
VGPRARGPIYIGPPMYLLWPAQYKRALFVRDRLTPGTDFVICSFWGDMSMEDRGWTRNWQWPWKDGKSTAQEKLVGLGRMHDRLIRKHVWVHKAPEKYKPILRTYPKAVQFPVPWSKTLTGKLHK